MIGKESKEVNKDKLNEEEKEEEGTRKSEKKRQSLA